MGSKLWEDVTSKKDIELMLRQAESNEFKRELNVWHLLFLGIGSMIGTGIYVLSGIIAANNAGPAVILSFLMASLVASLAALCYSELSAMIPVSGSAYSYTYATMGEFVAWLVGWTFLIESLVGTSAVAVGWSGYLVQFIEDGFQLKLSPSFTESFIKWNGNSTHLELSGNFFNLPAVIIITLLSILLIVGTKESATVTVFACMIKVGIIFIFVIGASPNINVDNFHPFIPPAQGDYFGHFGIMGVLKGASIAFFCFGGFDSISSISQEAKSPRRDIPIAIMGSLTISSILYILVCFVLVGIAPYKLLNVPHPITLAISLINKKWLGIVVGASAVIGMITSILMGLLGQSRILYNMSNDGLLPPIFSKIHPQFNTPYISQILIWLIMSCLAGLIPINILSELSGIGTLLTYFLVCSSVLILRLQRPNLYRPFKIPGGTYGIPLLGALTIIILILASVSLITLIPLSILILLGIIIYFSYSRYHSLLRFQSTDPHLELSAMIPVNHTSYEPL